MTALERALQDRAGQSVLDTDFYDAVVDQPIRIRVAVDELPDELIAMDAFGGFLAGIDDDGEWMHDQSASPRVKGDFGTMIEVGRKGSRPRSAALRCSR